MPPGWTRPRRTPGGRYFSDRVHLFDPSQEMADCLSIVHAPDLDALATRAADLEHRARRAASGPLH
ncbi:hypothetical protein D5H75_33015 [Bailinhaonella thermotolerans]|uniref:Uncharacterized protein n=2 Tax=Bailinhaonella thermotolerans TaxID=1070861 RepID=A0A3A4A5M3_9ACTN|nr:hypothetical protein D5H75_33015 [Bailinhaonella thermotolerans]